MIVTEFYKGQGLGNQLACYVATRVFALDKGYAFGIKSPEKFKGLDFLNVDFGEEVIGGSGPDGGPAITLPQGIVHYYSERMIIHPKNGSNITLYDKELVDIKDHTKIDGLMQDEQYIAHHKNEIKEWLAIKPEFECFDYSDENTCVINFRGGEYARHPEFFLEKKYWNDAIATMLKINPNFRFIVITDDTITAKKFFPHFSVFHFSIGKDYSIIKNAHYLILSNSSFAWFPAWTSEVLKYCIAPKYWARHNISDGYWSLGYNITTNWYYLDRDGTLSDYNTCIAEFKQYQAEHPELFDSSTTYQPQSKPQGIKFYIKNKTPVPIKNIIKSAINEAKNSWAAVRLPYDLLIEKKRRKSWLTNIEISEYRKKIKIYDAFNFFNELETLDIRLNILNPYVDYFVLVESTLTHSGLPKELFYQNNKHLFREFEHKILHFVIEKPLQSFEDARERLSDPTISEVDKAILTAALSSDNIQPGETSFLRDFYEKEYVKKALLSLNLNDNDFCYISDLDEIWNPDAPIDYSKDDVFKYKQDPYIYYLNNRSNEDWGGWTGTIGTKFKNIKSTILNHLRTRGKTSYTVIKNGGWHFSFQGGAKRVQTKIESYSHQEINNNDIKSKIKSRIAESKDVRGRYIKFWKDESKLPSYLLKNKDKYPGFFR